MVSTYELGREWEELGLAFSYEARLAGTGLRFQVARNVVMNDIIASGP